MINSGFIKISRNIINTTWYSCRNVRLVFLDLFVRACWCDEEYLGVHLRRGQVAISVAELATSNQLTPQQVRTTLNKLKSTGDITTVTTPKFTIITLNNYDLLQGFNKPDNKQSTNTLSQNQQTCSSEINKPTYLNNKKEIKEERKRMPAAHFDDENFSCKSTSHSSNTSYDVNEVVERIKARRYGNLSGSG